jgi:hypothetical protein
MAASLWWAGTLASASRVSRAPSDGDLAEPLPEEDRSCCTADSSSQRGRWSLGRATLVNGLLWLGILAIPMTIAVILRRLGRKYGLDARSPSEDPAQEPDYRRWG